MALSFQTDIAGLFSQKEVSCMTFRGVALADYAYMGDANGDVVYVDHANARHVYARLEGTETPRMPIGGDFWSSEKLSILKSWIDGGCAP